MFYKRLLYKILILMGCGVCANIGLGASLVQKGVGESRSRLSVAAKALKDVYEPGEPVPLVVAIANHGSEPVYISLTGPAEETRNPTATHALSPRTGTAPAQRQ